MNIDHGRRSHPRIVINHEATRILTFSPPYSLNIPSKQFGCWKEIRMTYEKPEIVEKVSVVGQLNRGSGPRGGGPRGGGPRGGGRGGRN